MLTQRARELQSEPLVWYAVYGSNLLRSRFLLYLEGKTSAQIRADQSFRLHHKLYFAYESSTRWGNGGVAFVGLERVTPPPTLGRAYLLSLSQFKVVAEGENGGIDVKISPEDLVGKQVEISSRGRYRVLLPCGSLRRIPVVTLTGKPGEATPRTLPSSKYLDVILRGLKETYPRKSSADIERYIQEVLRSNVS